MFPEPLEDRYNEVLKQRLSLEGEVAILRKRYDYDLAKMRKRKNFFMFLMVIIPILTWFLIKKPTPSVDNGKIIAQKDSLQNLLNIVEKTKIKQIKYIVTKGDNPSSLANLFYNDEKAASQIIKDNNLDARGFDRELKVGDTLLINIR